MLPIRSSLARAASAAAFIACAFPCAAQTASSQGSAATYPVKPIRMLVPYPPGGPTDYVARVVAQRLEKPLGKQIVVDNRAGGGGVIATATVAQAPPDGYTLLMGTPGQLVLLPLLMAKLPYTASDFAAITKVVDSPQVLIGSAKLPANTLPELIAYAKQRPGQLTYASVQTGGTGHLGMELLKQMTGTDMVHVPYKGTAPALTDIMGGRVQLMFSSLPSVQPHVQAGRLKLLATGAPKRTAAIKDVPTVAETVPGYELRTWYGLFAPKRIPAAILRRLHEDAVRVLTSEDIAQLFASQGVEPAQSTPAELEAYMRSESARWGKVIRTAGITLE